MSSTTRRKHVMKEMMKDDYALPKSHQQIVRIVGTCGNNLHEVETSNSSDQKRFLVSMPTKFRNNMWVKRGDYVIIEPIEEGHKVKGEICKILTREHIKEYTKAGAWPECFTQPRNDYATLSEQQDDLNDYLTPNTNRPKVQYEVEESDDEDDDTHDYLAPNRNKIVARYVEDDSEDESEDADDE